VTTLPPRDPLYDPTCYLCPGNMRVSGNQNPMYGGVYVFDNDHPCVRLACATSSDTPVAVPRAPCRWHCPGDLFSPAHNQTLAEMTPAAITDVVNVWQQQTYDLGQSSRSQSCALF
jgi:UDPglucose--hexose-1-phosphate uridylyltransferase